MRACVELNWRLYAFLRFFKEKLENAFNLLFLRFSSRLWQFYLTVRG